MISVITIALNQEKYIEETIKSVLVQKNDLVEYIVIDGGSSDNTCKIIYEYINQIDFFISEKDNGIYDALNKGIRLSKNELICFIHAGDTLMPYILQKVIEKHSIGTKVLYYGDILIKDEEKSKIKRYNSFVRDFKSRMTIFHPSTIISRKVYDDIGYYSTRYQIVSDYDFILRCYFGGILFQKIDEVISIFRTGGISSKKTYRRVYEQFIMKRKYFSFHLCLFFFIRDLFLIITYSVYGQMKKLKI